MSTIEKKDYLPTTPKGQGLPIKNDVLKEDLHGLNKLRRYHDIFNVRVHNYYED